jgi:ABC-type xylose transport system permease subunit
VDSDLSTFGESSMETVYQLIMGLLAIVINIIAAIESFARNLMNHAHIPDQVQSVTLLVLAIVLIIAAFRILGGIFGLLVALFLFLFLLHVMVPGFTENFQPPHN